MIELPQDSYRIPSKDCEPLLDLIARKMQISQKDMAGRDVLCTPILSDYGCHSFWTISIEGSPPRGTVIFDCVRYCDPIAFLVYQGEFKGLKGKDYDVVDDFVDQFLKKLER